MDRSQQRSVKHIFFQSMIPAVEPIDLPKAAKPRPSLVEVRAERDCIGRSVPPPTFHRVMSSRCRISITFPICAVTLPIALREF